MSVSGNDSGSPLEIPPRVPTSPQAWTKRRIATLMEEVKLLKQDKATKHRKTIYYVSQGRAIRRLVTLYTPIEDLIAENDRQCEYRDSISTLEQDRLQRSYVELVKVLPWIHDKIASVDNEESEDMLRKLKRGTDSARGDDTGTLKELMASWVNIEFHPNPLISGSGKHHRGFVNDICGKLLCPAEWCWDDLSSVKAGIQDRMTAFIVSKNSWPLFMYQNFAADAGNLEHSLMKSKLLVMGLKALFTSPSSANEMDGQGQGADIIENNRRAWRQDQAKVKTFLQIRFTLSSITSWHNVDGDFDYEMFWNNVVDFFEDAPGPAVRARVNELLEWWTRKVFGRNHRQDLTSDVISRISIRVLAAQRLVMEDTVFDSDS
ncbi:hypothetical protein DFH29DRAFT_816077 [Suillus ampliporus]|nr:hypothetical protein DFH29DRAFT_816077 [Suillus ampliporus]